jgi:membrane associated rhomboid family serine protease
MPALQAMRRTRHPRVECCALDATLPTATLTAPPPARPPWEKLELFALRPDQPDYGYVVRGVRHGCTRDELVARCRASAPHVDVVWTPEYPRLLPPAEVPWLVDAVRERARDNLRYNVRNGLTLTLIYSVLALSYHYQGYPWPLLAVIVFMLGIVPVLQPAWGLWRLRRDPEGYTREQAGILRYQMWLGTRRANATLALAACLVVVGLTQWWVGTRGVDTIRAAGLVKSAVRGGEVWRLLTCELLHGHVLHFTLNLLALMALGRLVEMHGHPAYLPTVFLFSALCASGLSYYASPVTSVGASGGIMGLIGFLAMIGVRRRHVVPRGFLKAIALSVALTAGTGLVAHEFIDNAAHAGGFIGGLLLGGVYVTRHGGSPSQLRLTPSTPAKVAGAASAVAIAVATLATVWVLAAAAH